MNLGNNNQWLFFRLKTMGIKLRFEYTPYIVVAQDPPMVIWSPGPGEYIVTEEMVHFLKSEGVDLISYPRNWANASLEAEAAAEEIDLIICEHKETFKLIKARYGN